MVAEIGKYSNIFQRKLSEVKISYNAFPSVSSDSCSFTCRDEKADKIHQSAIDKPGKLCFILSLRRQSRAQPFVTYEFRQDVGTLADEESDLSTLRVAEQLRKGLQQVVSEFGQFSSRLDRRRLQCSKALTFGRSFSDGWAVFHSINADFSN